MRGHYFCDASLASQISILPAYCLSTENTTTKSFVLYALTPSVTARTLRCSIRVPKPWRAFQDDFASIRLPIPP